MKPEQLTDQMRRLIRPADRKTLGKAGMTSEEAIEKFVVKSEMDIHKQIIGVLDIRGIAYQRNRPDKKTGATLGWPDFTFCVTHHQTNEATAMAFEVKHESKGLDPDQKRCIKKMLANGWAVYLVRSMEDAKRFLDRHVWEDPSKANWGTPTNITPEELEE